MSLLRDTFNNQDKRRAPGSEKKLKKILQKKIVTFFQVESETILDLGMSALFQKILEELLDNQKITVEREKNRSRSPSSCSDGSSRSQSRPRVSMRVTPPKQNSGQYRSKGGSRESSCSGEKETHLGLPPKARTSSNHNSDSKSEKGNDKNLRVRKLEEDYQNYWKPREEPQLEEVYQMTQLRTTNKDLGSAGSTKGDPSAGGASGHHVKAFDQHVFGSNSHHSVNSNQTVNYASSKFSVPKLDTTPKDLIPNTDPGTPTHGKDKEAGLISRKLKEVMRLTGMHLTMPDGAGNSHKETMPPQNKEYNSLSVGFNNTLSSNGMGLRDDQEHRSLPADRKNNIKPEESFMVAKYDFQGEKPKDLSFRKGDVVRLIDKKKGGWWFAEVDNRFGYVPSNFLATKEEMGDDQGS